MRTEETLQQVIRPLVPHLPSDVQRDFLALDCEEALFGGAAGGGKTDGLLMAALQYVDRPGYTAALFRRNEKDWQQPGSALQLANEWLHGTTARWSPQQSAWVFPSGALIHFGFGSTLKQIIRSYQGSQYQFLGFDELTQWPESFYRYLFSRCRRRSEAIDVPARVRATCNPGGEGHGWVKRRFVADARNVTTGTDVRDDIRARNHGQLMPVPRVYVSPPSDEARRLAMETGVAAQGAYFVPAFLSDNPGIDAVDYRSKLLRLDPVTRAQLERGDWDVVSDGTFFKASYFNTIVKQPPGGLNWVRSWDLAATDKDAARDPDWTAGSKQAVQRMGNHEVRLYIGGVRRFQMDAGDTEREIASTARQDGLSTRILMEQEPGSAGKASVHGFKSRVLAGYAVESERRTGPKEEYWRPVASLASAGGLVLVEGPYMEALIEELTNLPVGHDDQADAISLGYFWQMRFLSSSGNVTTAIESTRGLFGGLGSM